jgi:hypothetical protein
MTLPLILSAASMALTVTAAGEDILFPMIYPNSILGSNEYARAEALNMTIKVVDLDEWANMTTADFAQHKSIVIADTINYNRGLISFLNESKAIWSPAVKGNIIFIGKSSFPSNSIEQWLTIPQARIRRTIAAAHEVALKL